MAAPRTVTGGGNNCTRAGYEQVASSGFASDMATYDSGSLRPFPVHPPELDSQLPSDTADPALLSSDAAAQLALNSYLNCTNMPSLPSIPLSSHDTTYLPAHNSTGTVNGQPQQPEVSDDGHSVGQIRAPSGENGQYLLGYVPYYNSTQVPGPQPLGVHSGFVSPGSFDVQEFQEDVENLSSMNGSLKTCRNTRLRTTVPSVKGQRDRPTWPAPLSYPLEPPVRHSPIHRPHPLTPRLRAIAKYWPHRVRQTVKTDSSDGVPESYPSLNSLPPASYAPSANTSFELVSSFSEPTDPQPTMVRASPVDPLPTFPNAPEPPIPTLGPVQAYGHLSKDHWKFFRTSQTVLAQVTGGPRGKQVHACQYIDPRTKMRCFHMKCHGPDGKPLAGKGFPIKDLEDYLRHLWLHRHIERMLPGSANPALMTVWDDATLDAQKALDDAKGIVYPYSP